MLGKELYTQWFLFDLEDMESKEKFVNAGAQELAYYASKKIDKPAMYKLVLTLSEVKV
jgi:hypothetical protein